MLLCPPSSLGPTWGSGTLISPPVCARSPLSPQHQPLHPEVSQWDTDGGGGHGDGGGGQAVCGAGGAGGPWRKDGVPSSSGCSQPPPHPLAQGGDALIGERPSSPPGLGRSYNKSGGCRCPVVSGRGWSLVCVSPASVTCDERGRSRQGAGGLGEVGVTVPPTPAHCSEQTPCVACGRPRPLHGGARSQGLWPPPGLPNPVRDPQNPMGVPGHLAPITPQGSWGT